MKKCFVCNEVKELDSFYTHKSMPDGRLNKCKECTKKQSKEREEKLRQNPEWVEQEKIRAREKYHRLYKDSDRFEVDGNYNAVFMTEQESKIAINKQKADFKIRFPEKTACHNLCQRMVVEKGKERHHWSYNIEHACDIIPLSIKEHNKLHKYIVYDQEHYMYRRIDTMELLDTKQKHIDYYNSLADKL